MKISIEAHIEQEIEAVWWAWNDPDCIARWNAASSDWHTTGSRVDLVVGGRFCHHMAAKDGSAGFDFTGTFTRVEAPTRLSFVMDDGREVDVQFASEPGGTWVQETFDAETSHTPAQQQAGWQDPTTSNVMWKRQAREASAPIKPPPGRGGFYAALLVRACQRTRVTLRYPAAPGWHCRRPTRGVPDGTPARWGAGPASLECAV